MSGECGAGPDREADRRRARRLYAEACELEARGEYYEARDRYRASLELVEDDEVLAAYLSLLSAIGPL